MKPLLIAIAFAAFFASCGGGTAGNADDTANRILPDSECAVSVVRQLFQWYSANRGKMDSIRLVNVPGSTDSIRFTIQFDAVKEYIGIMSRSGLFTEQFLKDKYEYFRRCEETLAKTHQNDGPPPCLASDILLYSQEPEVVLAESASMKTQVGPIRAEGIREVTVNGLSDILRFTIQSVDGKCLIDSIAPVATEGVAVRQRTYSFSKIRAK